MEQVVVVGTSAGGRQALGSLLRPLPADFPAPICIVQHFGPWRSALPSFLKIESALPVAFGTDGEPLRKGRVYVAPPDHHLLVHSGSIELTRGPRENFVRPSVDPLFRSAAAAFGPGTIGVILTGNLNDGTAGLYEIKRSGGITIVQDPADAEVPGMPTSACQNVEVDHCLPIDAIAGTLLRLVRQRGTDAPAEAQRRGEGAMAEPTVFAEPGSLVCPECGGALRADTGGTLRQFKCHIGHRMSAEVLAAAQADLLERNADELVRLLNERVHLCRDMAAHHRARDDTESAGRWKIAEREAHERMVALAKMAAAQWTRPEVV